MKNKSYATAAQLTAAPNKLLGSAPTMVDHHRRPASPASYTLAYVAPCTGTAVDTPSAPSPTKGPPVSTGGPFCVRQRRSGVSSLVTVTSGFLMSTSASPPK